MSSELLLLTSELLFWTQNYYSWIPNYYSWSWHSIRLTTICHAMPCLAVLCRAGPVANSGSVVTVVVHAHVHIHIYMHVHIHVHIIYICIHICTCTELNIPLWTVHVLRVGIIIILNILLRTVHDSRVGFNEYSYSVARIRVNFRHSMLNLLRNILQNWSLPLIPFRTQHQLEQEFMEITDFLTLFGWNLETDMF